MENVTNKNVGLNGRLYYTLLCFVFKDNVPDSDCSLSLSVWLKYQCGNSRVFSMLYKLFHALLQPCHYLLLCGLDSWLT